MYTNTLDDILYIVVLIVLAIITIALYFYNTRNEEPYEDINKDKQATNSLRRRSHRPACDNIHKNKQATNNGLYNIRNYIIEILKASDLQYKETGKEEDGEEPIYVKYQDVSFRILADNKSRDIAIQYLFWYSFPANDTEKFATMQKVVNEANTVGRWCTMYYTTHSETNTTWLHSRITSVFVPDPYSIETLKFLFIVLFQSRNFFVEEYIKAITSKTVSENDNA